MAVYLTELKTFGSSFVFGEHETRLLRDRIVFGIRDKGLKERLLLVSDVTLKKVVDPIRVSEISSEQIKAINDFKCCEKNSIHQKKKPRTLNIIVTVNVIEENIIKENV